MKERRQRLGAVIRILHYNRWILFSFEVLYKLLGVTLFVPFLYSSFDLLLRITGYNYLTFENVWKFLRNPLVYLFLGSVILLIVLYAAVDMGAVIYILHCSQCREKTSLSSVIRFAFRNMVFLFRKGNRGLLLTILLYLPFFNIAQVPEIMSTYSMPNMLLLNLGGQWAVTGGIVLAGLLIAPLFIRDLYAFHYFTLLDLGKKEAVKRSSALRDTKEKVKDLLLLMLVQILCIVAFILVLAVGIFLVILFGRLFARVRFFSSLIVRLVKGVITVALVVFGLLGTPICCIVVNMRFYRHRSVKKESSVSLEQVEAARGCVLTDVQKSRREQLNRLLIPLEILVLVVTIFLCSVYVNRMHRGELNLNIEYLKTTEVTAHRGASRFYPENTMSAFWGALEAGADWIELDIRQSSDGQLFVMHDLNLYRTTGKDALSWNLTYDEISRLDAGSFFSDRFAGEKIPLLSEVIDFAKENGIRLNIEIKPTMYDVHLEENLVELIEEKDFIGQCVVASQIYDSIAAVKKLNEDITTIYVTGFAYGNINRMIYADGFSIRASSITDALVSRLHNAGKQVYAWTVNNKDSINLMMDHQVDNIITDNVALAKTCIGTKMASDAVNDYVNFLNRQIRLIGYRFGK